MIEKYEEVFQIHWQALQAIIPFGKYGFRDDPNELAHIKKKSGAFASDLWECYRLARF